MSNEIELNAALFKQDEVIKELKAKIERLETNPHTDISKSRLLRIISWVCPSCNEYHVIGGCLGCIHFKGGYPYLKGSKCQKCNALHINWEGP